MFRFHELATMALGAALMAASVLLSINVILVAERFPDPPLARAGALLPEVSVVAASSADAAAESR